jgi:hypothetical protein
MCGAEDVQAISMPRVWSTKGATAFLVAGARLRRCFFFSQRYYIAPKGFCGMRDEEKTG